jgi:cytochrome d ubiquinol oxidase subunit I
MSMPFDALHLARAQFALTMSFHFVFPAFSIGLASYLVVLEALWLKTRRSLFLDLFRYWLKIFALVFGMGVVSGVVMSYQIGTNWSGFSNKAGPVIGPLMAYEVLTAFFLEAGFLGVMLFGMSKVGKRLHFFATLMVALGTLISATWIVSANSWMQTPAGFAVNAKGQFVPADSWWPIIFNPSFPYRLVHTVLAAYLTTAVAVGAVGAWQLLKDRTHPHARMMFSMAMGMLVIVAPLQILAGDTQGLNTLKYQPVKVFAMEGDFDPSPAGAPLVLFGLPSNVDAQVHDRVAIPKLGSLILEHDANKPLGGLKDYPSNRWPTVAVVFWSFRLMVGLALAMLILGLWGFGARLRGRLYDSRMLHQVAVVLGPAGFIAVIAGWVTSEAGRQPYTVYGQLLTAESLSPLAAPAIATSLACFAAVYFVVFGVGAAYLIRMMAGLPSSQETEPLHIPQRAAGITPAAGIDHGI